MPQFSTTRATLAGAVMLGAFCGQGAAQPWDFVQAAPVFFRTSSAPVDVRVAPDEPSTVLYVAGQRGVIYRGVYSGSGTPAPVSNAAWFDLTSRVQYGGEQGLLSLVFHPEFAVAGSPNAGTCYVYYNAPLLPGGSGSSRTVIARLRRDPGDPQAALFVGEVFTFNRPGGNHNGGCMQFGPDGMLYVASGDGGSSSSAQDSRNLMGKILRLDVTLRPGDDPAAPARVPPDNPVVPIPAGATTGTPRPEIWVMGLRNPWRFSFDPPTGDMYIADVGSGSREEVSVLQGNAPAGANFGWPRFEGLLTTSSSTALAPGQLITPVYDYPRNPTGSITADFTGTTVTGGYVYHGRAFPWWRGRYFFADYSTRKLWSLRLINGAAVDVLAHTPYLGVSKNYSSFGVDHQGELLVCTLDGYVYKLVPQAPLPSLADVYNAGGAAPGPDGFLTGEDFDSFIQAFFAGGELADVATEGSSDPNAGPDGFITGTDFDAFIVLFFTG